MYINVQNVMNESDARYISSSLLARNFERSPFLKLNITEGEF